MIDFSKTCNNNKSVVGLVLGLVTRRQNGGKKLKVLKRVVILLCDCRIRISMEWWWGQKRQNNECRAAWGAIIGSPL